MARGRPSGATVYRRLGTAITDRLGGLPTPREAAAVRDDIWHLEAHQSTAREGNMLVLRESRLCSSNAPLPITSTGS